jgi:Rhomboid family
VGSELDHRHVPARRLGPHLGQHAVPGDLRQNVEDAFGPLLYLGFYFAAMMLQTAMTLLSGRAAEARVPELGASGAIAAVLGAYFLLYPAACS